MINLYFKYYKVHDYCEEEATEHTIQIEIHKLIIMIKWSLHVFYIVWWIGE